MISKTGLFRGISFSVGPHTIGTYTIAGLGRKYFFHMLMPLSVPFVAHIVKISIFFIYFFSILNSIYSNLIQLMFNELK